MKQCRGCTRRWQPSARLRAEVSNKPLVFPDELNKFPELIESETALYNTRRDGLNKATTGLTQGISSRPTANWR